MKPDEKDKDALEYFILRNRDQMDIHEPPAEAWEKLAPKLPVKIAEKEPKMVPITRLWQVAASFTLLLVTMLAWQLWKHNTIPFAERASLSSPQLEELAPELAEAEKFYRQQIKSMKANLDRQQLAQLGLDQDYDAELKNLEQNYAELKKELLQGGGEAVVDAMILNLQYQMEVISLKMAVLEKVQGYKKRYSDVSL